VKITPLDIRRKEFKRSVRGYTDEEVDIFLDEVADEFERLFQANMELEDKVHHLEEQSAGLTQVREALEKTLITAQVQSEDMRSNAHKESELILRDAELKARGIVHDSYGETQKVQQALFQLKLLEEDFRFKFRSLLEGYLKLLSEAPIAAQTAETAALTAPPSPAPIAAAEPQPADAAPVAPAGPQSSLEKPAPAPSEDDTPTEENEAVVAHVNAAIEAFTAAEAKREADLAPDEEVTAETNSLSHLMRPSPRQAPEPEPTEGGFFFGKQATDIDDTFQGEDDIKADKTRDFKW
jgi:cell division initiation protein